jgi:hypothetical protein
MSTSNRLFGRKSNQPARPRNPGPLLTARNAKHPPLAEEEDSKLYTFCSS